MNKQNENLTTLKNTVEEKKLAFNELLRKVMEEEVLPSGLFNMLNLMGKEYNLLAMNSAIRNGLIKLLNDTNSEFKEDLIKIIKDTVYSEQEIKSLLQARAGVPYFLDSDDEEYT